MKKLLMLVVAALLPFTGIKTAAAQNWPTQTIRFVVPFAAEPAIRLDFWTRSARMT
jgi:tripartite-type tricarboxylate transporter receptor subunit TctC